MARPDPAVLAEDLRTATFIVRPAVSHFEFAHTALLEDMPRTASAGSFEGLGVEAA